MKKFALICLATSSTARHHLICDDESGMCYSPLTEENSDPYEMAQFATLGPFLINSILEAGTGSFQALGQVNDSEFMSMDQMFAEASLA